MKRSSTRQHIVQTASDLFYKNGYNLTGINEIIAKAGIAKATLYNHFRSKEDLCIAYLDFKDEELIRSIDEFTKVRPEGDDRLVAVLEFLIDFFDSGDFHGCWCIRTVAELPANDERIRTKIRGNKKTFRQFLSQLVRDNKPDLSEKDQAKLTNQVYMLYESAVAESHLQGESWPIRESIDLLNSVLK